MNTLKYTGRDNVFLIAAAGYAGALTRNNGVASNALRDRIINAIQRTNGALYITGLKFAQSPTSGKWYVRIITGEAPAEHCTITPYPLKNKTGSHTSYGNIGPICEWNRSMVAKHGTGVQS